MDKTNYILNVENLSKSFGGIKAIQNVTFNINTGEKVGIIGPNGAGKTTLFNLITGFLKIDQGIIKYKDKEITNKAVRHRSLEGISRTFQTTKVFLEMTVRENLFLAANKNEGTFNIFKSWEKDTKKLNKCKEVSKKLGIENLLNEKCSKLSHGMKRKLGIAQAVVSDTDLLMLDEPAAGLPAEERENLAKLIKQLTKNISLIIIDHDMDIIFDIADRVIVLNQGKIIANNTPQEIQNNKEVQQIYIGEGGQEDGIFT